MKKLPQIKRLIYYYELVIDFNNELTPSDGDNFRDLFNTIVLLSKNHESIRYQTIGEKAVFINEIKFDPTNKLIIGKLRCVRKDILPEIMDTSTDEARGIEAKEEEGILETTHFIIDYSKKKKKIAIEFNQFGAKINDFVYYVFLIGQAKNILKKTHFIPIVKDELSKIKERISRCSEFTVKIHKDNIESIKSMDSGIYTSMKQSIDQFKCDYATINLKFDYKKRTDTNSINKSINNIISSLIKRKKDTELFEILTVKAEDSEKKYKLELFDLLIDKVKSDIWVQKKERYRTIISADMFEKMKLEMLRKNI